MKFIGAIVLIGGVVITVAVIAAMFSLGNPSSSTPAPQAAMAKKHVDLGLLRGCRTLLWLLLPVVSIVCFFVAMKVAHKFGHDGAVSQYIGLVISFLCAVPPFTILWWTGTLRQKVNDAHRRTTNSPTPLIPSRWTFF